MSVGYHMPFEIHQKVSLRKGIPLRRRYKIATGVIQTYVGETPTKVHCVTFKTSKNHINNIPFWRDRQNYPNCYS